METQFTNLRNEITKEINDRLAKDLSEINTIEGLVKVSNWHGKKYAGDFDQCKAKLAKYLEKKANKDFMAQIGHIHDVETADDFKGEFVVKIEWTPSQIWRANPRAYTSKGFVGKSISGCGYDKLSTAYAEGLNSNLSILKLLYAIKDINISISNHKIFGYGSGYGILPEFEGGVGSNSLNSILEGVGLEVSHIEGKMFDVYTIRSR